jgi:hypothetical protein
MREENAKSRLPSTQYKDARTEKARKQSSRVSFDSHWASDALYVLTDRKIVMQARAISEFSSSANNIARFLQTTSHISNAYAC